MEVRVDISGDTPVLLAKKVVDSDPKQVSAVIKRT
jgi:hypothetical protein